MSSLLWFYLCLIENNNLSILLKNLLFLLTVIHLNIANIEIERVQITESKNHWVERDLQRSPTLTSKTK